MEENISIVEIFKIIGPLIGGGAAGAFITWGVTNYRNKVQKVEYDIVIDKIFFPEIEDKDITKITFSGATNNYHFDNLFIVTIVLKNIGNKEIENFSIDITFPEAIKVIRTESISPSRSHKMNVKSEVDFDNPSHEIDVDVKPFNRDDKYSLKLYLTIFKDTIELDDIKISSSHAVKFTPASTFTTWNSVKKVMEIIPYIP